MLDGEGGYTVFGKVMPAEESMRIGGLPLGLAHKVRLVNAVPAGQQVRWDDVEIDEDAERRANSADRWSVRRVRSKARRLSRARSAHRRSCSGRAVLLRSGSSGSPGCQENIQCLRIAPTYKRLQFNASCDSLR